jgi:hypothetical protein
MKRLFVLFLVVAVSSVFAVGASAQQFKDVPADHWAASSVYDLVKLGVTKGYPDGTFRGKKNITRYESAVMISKLAKALGGDVKADIRALKSDIAALKKGGPVGGSAVSGAYMADWMAGNLLAEKGGIRGAVASYRLKLATAYNLGGGSNVKINLDTMDYGYMDDGSTATGGILATQLLDIESNLVLDMAALGIADPVDVKVTFGPGNKMHAADPAGPIPSEVGVTYMRPDTGIVGSTKLWGMDVSGGYIAKDHSTSGRVLTSDVTGMVGYTFEDTPVVDTFRVAVTGDYYSTGMLSTKTRDMRGTIMMAAPLGDKIEATGTIGIGGSKSANMMVAGEFALNDVLNTGTVATINFSKIGSDFITDAFAAAEWDIAGFDNFSRPLQEGTVNLGGTVTQNVSEDIKLVGKGDIRLEPDYAYESPKGRLTAQGGVSYAVAPNTSLDAVYRIHQDKATDDTSDLAALGLIYSF